MPAELLAEFSRTVRAVAATAGPATVVVGRHGRGAGIVVGPGRVLTNAHNLRDRTTVVTFADGRAVPAAVAGIDADGDLAVLDVDTGDAPAIGWADHTIEQGDVVFAVARRANGARVTVGLITATGQSFRGPRGRRIAGSVEHSAPLARGSSGGPLLDADGLLVGINTHRLGDGFTLAIAADADLRRRIDALGRGESPTRRRLGVAIASAEVTRRLRQAVGLPPRAGLLVRGVEPDSAAARAGIQEGDLLVAAGGRPLATDDDVFAALDAAGDTIELVVVRGTEERTVSCVLMSPE